MRAEQHGGAALGRDPADVAEDLPLAGRVEAERRLVEEDDERVVHERARDSEALPHAAAEARDERAAAVEETDLPEEAARGRVRAGAPLAVEIGRASCRESESTEVSAAWRGSRHAAAAAWATSQRSRTGMDM